MRSPVGSEVKRILVRFRGILKQSEESQSKTLWLMSIQFIYILDFGRPMSYIGLGHEWDTDFM